MAELDEAQRLIEGHIATLEEQKSQLQRALVHLKETSGGEAQNNRRGQGAAGGKGRGAGAGKGRRAQGGGSAAGGERAPRGARREEVIADLKANPAARAGEVAGRVGINPNHAQTILGNLVQQGVATKEGQQYTLVAGKA